MKGIAALALLAILGFVVAGCGSGKHRATITFVNLGTTITVVKPTTKITFTRPTITTISNVKTGTDVSCMAGPGRKAVGVSVVVPPPGVGQFSTDGGTAGTAGPGDSWAKIKLTHLQDGSVSVSCRSSR